MSRKPTDLFSSIQAAAGTRWACSLRPESAANPSDAIVIELTRTENANARACRTILVRALRSFDDDYPDALRAAAAFREQTAEPTPSALYLMFVGGENVSPDECDIIESDSRYCRKLVWHAEEHVDDFLARTFFGLSSIAPADQDGSEGGPQARILERLRTSASMDQARALGLLNALAAMDGAVAESAEWLLAQLEPADVNE